MITTAITFESEKKRRALVLQGGGALDIWGGCLQSTTFFRKMMTESHFSISLQIHPLALPTLQIRYRCFMERVWSQLILPYMTLPQFGRSYANHNDKMTLEIVLFGTSSSRDRMPISRSSTLYLSIFPRRLQSTTKTCLEVRCVDFRYASMN